MSPFAKVTSSTSAAQSPPPPSAADTFCSERVPVVKGDKFYLQFSKTKLCMHELVQDTDGSWRCQNHAKHVA